MRKILCLCLVFLLVSGMTLAVSAQENEAQSSITVSEDGSCHVSFTMTLTLSEATDLQFPIPKNAKNVTLNGAAATVTPGDPAKVSLTPITGTGIGIFTLNLAYDLPAVVSSEKEGFMLTLPLLCPGFTHNLSAYSFTITLPGDDLQTPVFASGYYPEETVMEHLTVETRGNTIRGSYNGAVFAGETLTMTLPVDEAMFPDPAITARMMNLLDLVTLIIVVLAIVYFFAFMRPHIRRPQPRYTAPEGVTAGEVGRWLTGDSVDLTLLVISWAQMGYLRIRYESESKIILQKRMDMGNERSVFENQVFKALFGLRPSVDATGSHYARLCRDVKMKTRNPRDVFHPRSGNPHLFRILCVCAAFLTGIMLGNTFAPNTPALQILTGIFTSTLAVLIQIGAAKLILRQRQMLYISWLACGIWLLVSVLCGDWLMGIGMVIFQFLAGLALAYGGRRTELGSQHMYQLLGLRTHTRTVANDELSRLMRINPDYFHNIAPYALALNTDRAFARRFGNIRVPECSYLTDGRSRQFSPAEWMELLRKTVKAMDARSQRLPSNRIPRPRPQRRSQM